MPNPNGIKAAIRDGRKAHGVNMTMAAPGIVELLGTLGLDYIYIDGEHGPFGPGEVEEICRAADLCGMTPIARVRRAMGRVARRGRAACSSGWRRRVGTPARGGSPSVPLSPVRAGRGRCGLLGGAREPRTMSKGGKRILGSARQALAFAAGAAGREPEAVRRALGAGD